MKRCGRPEIHAAHDECDGGSNYVDAFDAQDVDYERGMYPDVGADGLLREHGIGPQ